MERDREVFCDSCREVLGGSTAIAAAVYARLGGNATLSALVGDDERGRFLRQRLSAAGVSVSALGSTDRAATGVTVNVVNEGTRSQITYPGAIALFGGPDAASLEGFHHVHVSGPYGMRAFLPRVAEFLQAAKEKGATLSLDTQWDASRKWRHLEDWLPLVDYLFVNSDEARSISGVDDEAGAWTVLSGRTANPIVKLGPRGAYAGGRAYPGIRVTLVDPTGAGDSFAAGFLEAKIGRGVGFEEAVDCALAAGAAACLYEGGEPPGNFVDLVAQARAGARGGGILSLSTAV